MQKSASNLNSSSHLHNTDTNLEPKNNYSPSQTTNKLSNGNGQQSIRGRKRKALSLESGQPLQVQFVHANDNDNNQRQHYHSLQQHQRILKKFGPTDPFDQVNSADLPAEFRDESFEVDQKEAESPREQSKLAKLCQQTSSVLASVLPAPFGGHKRSILCQFFGQIPLSHNNKKSSSKHVANNKDLSSLDSVAVIHPLDQTAQQPIMLMRPMKHPIELLLEHQRQQMQLAARGQQHQHNLAPLPQAMPLIQDLKSSASVLDHSYQQRLEAPQPMKRTDEKRQKVSPEKEKNQEKFSQLIGSSSSSPTLSTSGWRIFDSLPEQTAQPNQTSNSQLKASTVATSISLTTTSKSPKTTRNNNRTDSEISKPTNQSSLGSEHVSSVVKNNTIIPLSINGTSTPAATTATTTTTTISAPKEPNLSREKLGAAQLSVLGRPPNYAATNNQQAAQITKHQLSVGRGSESPKSTTKNHQESSELRTIEVNSQSNNSPTNLSKNDSPTTAKDTGKVSSSPTNQRANVRSNNQAQDREELVIASINNLTRIAFGNQLRDTFKVINKLIDQQAGLFASSPGPKSDSDLLMTSESQKVTKKIPPDSSLIVENKKRTKSREKEIPPSSSSSSSTPANLRVSNTQTLKTHKRVSPTVPAKKQNGTESQQPLKRLQQLSSTTIKANKSFGQNKGANSDLAHSNSTEHKQGERKSTISALESRRSSNSHTVSRSLSLDSNRKTTPFKPLAPFESNWPTTIVEDIRRDRSVRKKFTTDSPTKSHSAAAQNQLVSATQYPWLIPDESSVDLFGSNWATQATKTTASKRQPSSTTTSKRWIPRTTKDSLSRIGGKQTLVLNRLDNNVADQPTSKFDSLTTLKMSLGPSQSQRTRFTRPSPTTVAVTAAATTAETTFSQGSTSNQNGIQSRWIPTVGLSRPSNSEQSPTTTKLIVTTIKPVTTTAAAAAATTLSSTTASPVSIQTTRAESKWSKEPMNHIDSIEARASDSISKFTTTHWNEANEMLATTRRLFQQPQPQIAQTGEFFDAETISSWPERYQTMLENNLKSSTVAMETTRRNGETYPTSEQETAATTTSGKIARHRYDSPTTLTNEDQQQQQQHQMSQTTKRMDTVDSTSFVVLPANHKLSTVRDEYYSTGTTVDTQTPRATTVPMMEQLTTLGSKQNNQTGSLRPPYSELQQTIPADLMSSEPTQSIYNSSSVARRDIYEELLKSPITTRNFVGPHSSLAHHGLNLSALRLLSNSLFATLGSGSREAPDRNRSLISPPVDQSIGLNNLLKVADSESLNNSDRLLEMLGAQNSSFPMLSMSQYERMLNGTPSSDGYPEELYNNDTDIINKGNSSSKWLLGRASNLLNDLKHLEQRKAAAILAAIRYQVPGPLVRPWDLNSDLQQVNDRLDNAENDSSAERRSEAERDYLRAGLWLSRANDAIKWALMKQRVVPRNELEAKLNGRRSGQDDSHSSPLDRRVDIIPEETNDNINGTFVLDGNKIGKQDANYVFVAGNSSSSDDDINDSSRTLLRKSLFDQLNNTDHHRHRDNEFEFRSTDYNKRPIRRHNENQQYPRYIHMSDYKSNWNSKPIDLKPKSSGQQSSSAAIAERLRNNTRHQQHETSKAPKIVDRVKLIDKETDPNSLQYFDCSDKPSGFHPDANTNCQYRPFAHIQLPSTDEIRRKVSQMWALVRSVLQYRTHKK